MIATFTVLVSLFFAGVGIKPVDAEHNTVTITGKRKSPSGPTRSRVSRSDLSRKLPSTTSSTWDALENMKQQIELHSKKKGVNPDIIAACNLLTDRDYGVEKDTLFAIDMAATMLDFATSITPGVSWARDVYETLTGEDLFTKEKLGTGAITLAAMGVMLPLISWRKTTEARNVLLKVGLVEKLATVLDDAKVMISRGISTQGMATADTKKIAKMLGAEPIKHDRPYAALRNTVEFMREIGVSEPGLRKSFVKSFLPGAELMTLKNDLKVYRYYSDGYSLPRGAWVTPSLVNDPVNELALKAGRNYEVTEWAIPAGSKVLVGRAAPYKETTGGGVQIFVDMNVLQ
jgi:hypothetical protein